MSFKLIASKYLFGFYAFSILFRNNYHTVNKSIFQATPPFYRYASYTLTTVLNHMPPNALGKKL